MFKHYVHDSMPFFWTTEAVQSGKEVIGFYFDRLGLPQPVSRKSLYGSHILRWELTSQPQPQERRHQRGNPMFDTYTHPSGRIILKDKELTRIIEERIAEGGAAVFVKGPRQDGFGFKVHYLGADYFVEGAYTWDEEGFDTLAITETPDFHRSQL